MEKLQCKDNQLLSLHQDRLRGNWTWSKWLDQGKERVRVFWTKTRRRSGKSFGPCDGPLRRGYSLSDFVLGYRGAEVSFGGRL